MISISEITERVKERFWAKVEKSDGCWRWTASRTRGYGWFKMNGRGFSTHRISWMIHYGAIPIAKCVLHRCDTPLCVRPDHLFLGTFAENSADMAAKGRAASGDKNGNRSHPERTARGERQGLSKLTEYDVRMIRMDHIPGKYGNAVGLARKYGVNKATIRRILNRETWSHVS